MDRRQIIVLIGAGIAAASTGPRSSLSAATKIPRVGIIDDGPDWEAFRQELHELNYAEGHNIAFEYRRVDGTPDQFVAAARELTQIPVDVIAIYGTPAAQATLQARSPFPSLLSRSAIRWPRGWWPISRIPAATSLATPFSVRTS